MSVGLCRLADKWAKLAVLLQNLAGISSEFLELIHKLHELMVSIPRLVYRIKSLNPDNHIENFQILGEIAFLPNS